MTILQIKCAVEYGTYSILSNLAQANSIHKQLNDDHGLVFLLVGRLVTSTAYCILYDNTTNEQAIGALLSKSEIGHGLIGNTTA
jgi:hypothetical protein